VFGTSWNAGLAGSGFNGGEIVSLLLTVNNFNGSQLFTLTPTTADSSGGFGPHSYPYLDAPSVSDPKVEGLWTITAIGQSSRLLASTQFPVIYPALTLSASCNPCNLGPVTLTVRVDNPNPGLFPGTLGSGSLIEFSEGASDFGSAPVVNIGGVNAAVLTANFAAGSHSIDSLFFGGNPDGFVSLAFADLTVVVNKAVTSTSLTAYPNPVRAGSGLTLTAQVPFVAGFPPTGTVTFFEGSTQISSQSISSTGLAFAFLGLATGTHSITARYSGDSNYVGSTSPAVSLIVNPKIVPSFSFTATPSPFYAGVLETLTLAISAVGATPYGSVDFFEGSTKLGTTAVGAGNIATLEVTFAAGTHSLTAQYSGNPDVLPGGPAVLSLLVNPKLTATIAVTVSPNPVHAGDDVAITVTVSFPPGSLKPAGTVTFKAGSTAIATAPIDTVFSATSVGVVVKVRSGAAGTYSLSATYNGDLAYNPVTSPHLTLTVF
jgi:hypothetical protein